MEAGYIGDGILDAPDPRLASLVHDLAALALSQGADDNLHATCALIASGHPAEVLERTAKYLIDSGRHSIADMMPASDLLQ